MKLFLSTLCAEARGKVRKEKGIRLSGPGPGRKKAGEETSGKKHAQEDACALNAAESVFGVGKRKYCPDRITARLKITAGYSTAVNFFVLHMRYF